MDDATRRLQALLAPLTNYERTRPDRPRFTLATMEVLLERLGPAARVDGLRIQVGGSKGKGTTAAYLEALARAAGMRTGVFASPHVTTILERVRIDGRLIDEEALTRACERVIDAADGLDPFPSFFEVTAAAALLAFVDAGVELAVLEVGLGGRLDATTAVEVDASILTGVELEHTELLGETIPAIAAEKTWILRPGRVGLHGCDGEAAEVVSAHARRVGCRLLALDRDFGVSVSDDRGDERRLRLRAPDGNEAEVDLAGGAPPWEDRALALAWSALTVLRPGFPLPRRLERPRLPGRFELRAEPDGELLVLDGAHTEGSLQLVASAVAARWPGRPVTVLFATARGKRWPQMLDALRPVAGRFLITTVSGTASEDPAEVVAWLRARGAAAEVVPDAAAGLAALRRTAGPRLVTGSFYLVGELREFAATLGK